jgi:hypothetical protein
MRSTVGESTEIIRRTHSVRAFAFVRRLRSDRRS